MKIILKTIMQKVEELFILIHNTIYCLEKIFLKIIKQSFMEELYLQSVILKDNVIMTS